ncbi:unnamed protein product, partial [Meganyctiphanes norvegica]
MSLLVSLSAQPVGGAAAATSTRFGFMDGESSGSNQTDGSPETSLTKNQRRSRWAEETGTPTQIQGGISIPGVVIPAGVVVPRPVMPVMPMVSPITPNGSFSVPLAYMNMISEGEHIDAVRGVMVTKMTRNNPAIIAYAQRVFGSLDLSESQWKQCEEQMKMNVVFQLLQEKKRETDRLEQAGKVKYEYDSDEDTEGGTWEHKRFCFGFSMPNHPVSKSLQTYLHVAMYLPNLQLLIFIVKFQNLYASKDPYIAKCHDIKINRKNSSFTQMRSTSGVVGLRLIFGRLGQIKPISNGRAENQGLGVDRPDNLDIDDTEFDAYRKRMMLAYRFRPNPLNNPRRQYY